MLLGVDPGTSHSRDLNHGSATWHWRRSRWSCASGHWDRDNHLRGSIPSAASNMPTNSSSCSSWDFIVTLKNFINVMPLKCPSTIKRRLVLWLLPGTWSGKHDRTMRWLTLQCRCGRTIMLCVWSRNSFFIRSPFLVTNKHGLFYSTTRIWSSSRQPSIPSGVVAIVLPNLKRWWTVKLNSSVGATKWAKWSNKLWFVWQMVTNTGGRVWTSVISCKFMARHCETRLRLFPHESIRRRVVFYASSLMSSTHLRVWRVLGSCVVLVFVRRNWSTTGKTDLLWCVMTMSSFPTPPLNEWWISTTQTHSVPFCLYLHCCDKVHAVHRLRHDGFNIFIEEVVEIAWWQPQMGWCCPWWQTNVILYELTMVGTVFEWIQHDNSCATHFLHWLSSWHLCFSFSVTSIVSHQCCFGTFLVVSGLQHGWYQDFDHLTHFGTPHALWHWHLARPGNVLRWQSTPANPSWLPVWNWCSKLPFHKIVHVTNVNWLNQCLFSWLYIHLS